MGILSGMVARATDFFKAEARAVEHRIFRLVALLAGFWLAILAMAAGSALLIYALWEILARALSPVGAATVIGAGLLLAGAGVALWVAKKFSR